MRPVRVDSVADFVAGIKGFQDDWEEIRRDALLDALLKGGFVNDVIKRTPRSEYARYKNRADGHRYGQQRLLRSIIRSESAGARTDFALVHERINNLEVAFGPSADWDVPYAVAMHESKVPSNVRSREVSTKVRNPRTGRTVTHKEWTSGWSFHDRDYGNKYLEKPWDNNAIRTERQMMRNIDQELKKRGLL